MTQESVTVDSNQETHENKVASILAHYLRIIGTLVVAFGAFIFLVQGPFSEFTSGRLLGFLGFIGVLLLAGYTTGLKCKAQLGAGTFLALASALAPVAWAQMGALIYASTYGEVYDMPSSFRFSPVDLLSILALGSATLVINIAAIAANFFSFSVLARDFRKELSIGASLLGVLMIIPVRSPTIIAFASIGSLGCIWYFSEKMKRKLARSLTKEEYLSLVTLIIPVGIIAGRSFWYGDPQVVAAAFFGMLGSFLLYITKGKEETYANRSINFVGLSMLGIGYLALINLIFPQPMYSEAFSSLKHFSDAEYYWGLKITIAGYAYLAGVYHYTRKYRINSYVVPGATLFFAFMIATAQMLICDTLSYVFLALIVGVCGIVDGQIRQKAFTQVCGYGLASIAAIKMLANFQNILFASPWFTFAILGVGILLLSVFFERKNS